MASYQKIPVQHPIIEALSFDEFSDLFKQYNCGYDYILYKDLYTIIKKDEHTFIVLLCYNETIAFTKNDILYTDEKGNLVVKHSKEFLSEYKQIDKQRLRMY